ISVSRRGRRALIRWQQQTISRHEYCVTAVGCVKKSPLEPATNEHGATGDFAHAAGLSRTCHLRDCIGFNPLKHRYVTRPCDWLCSSKEQVARMSEAMRDDRTWVEADPACRFAHAGYACCCDHGGPNIVAVTGLSKNGWRAANGAP